MKHDFDIIHNSRPVLRFCEQFDDTNPLWNHSRHSHPYIELLFFLDGKGNLEVSGMQMSVSLFDAVAYPAGWQHQEEITPERRREIICLWIDLPELCLPSPIHLHDRDEAIGRLFQMIYGEAKRKRPEPLLLEQEIKTLLMLMLRSQSEAKAAEGVLAYVVQYLHAHYTEPITLEQLAQMEHISKSYLSRRFRQQTGMSVIRSGRSIHRQITSRLRSGVISSWCFHPAGYATASNRETDSCMPDTSSSLLPSRKNKSSI